MNLLLIILFLFIIDLYFYLGTISIVKKFVTLEKTGNPKEIFELFQILKPLGVFEYVKSGRVAISKPMKTLKEFLT